MYTRWELPRMPPRMQGESYCTRLRSLFLSLCDVFRELINSLVCWFCTSTLGLVLLFMNSLTQTVGNKAAAHTFFFFFPPSPLSLTHNFQTSYIYIFLTNKTRDRITNCCVYISFHSVPIDRAVDASSVRVPLGRGSLTHPRTIASFKR